MNKQFTNGFMYGSGFVLGGSLVIMIPSTMLFSFMIYKIIKLVNGIGPAINSRLTNFLTSLQDEINNSRQRPNEMNNPQNGE